MMEERENRTRDNDVINQGVRCDVNSVKRTKWRLCDVFLSVVMALSWPVPATNMDIHSVTSDGKAPAAHPLFQLCLFS